MLKFPDNLRYQIALILLLAIVPLAFIAVYLAVDDGRRDAIRAQAASRETVRLVAQDLNRVIQSTSDLVVGLSRNSLIRDHPDSCNSQLASLKPAFPQFANMVVMDADSSVLCAASDPKNVFRIPKSPENLTLLERVRQSRQVAVGSFVLMSAPGKRVLPLMGPVIEKDGQIGSFFRVTVDLDWLNQQVNRVQIPANAALLVMDGRGTEIARNPPDHDWPTGTTAPEFERTLVGKGDFEGEVLGYDGIKRFYSVARVRAGENLLVVMKMRASAIYLPTRRRLLWHLGGLASVGLLVLGLTWIGSDRYFRHPLSKLITTANGLAAGNLEARTGLDYRGEIGALAQSFDRMADRLEEDQAKERLAAAEKAKLQAQLNQAQKMESIGRLAGGVAHDFNNLLTVINGYSGVLVSRLDGPSRKHAEQINKAGQSAANLTRQLLAFSRMEETNPQPVRVNTVVTESVDMLERLVGAHIEMKTSLYAVPDKVLADSNQIHQCLMNLVVNASDAMPGGGQLRIDTGNVQVTTADLPVGSNGGPGPHVRLTVGDTGTGMDEDTGQRIFDPFFTTKEKGKGTGLGLSTVYGIVTRWQGFIKVATAPGKGSEFSIYLPQHSGIDVPNKARAAETEMFTAGSETVLVVDDQDIVREFVVESLSMYGYRVLEARNGAEALQLIERNPSGIHLMMTDVMMPGISGKELVMRAKVVSPSMKVLFMTGYSDGAISEEDGPDGRHEVIRKPFAPEDLGARVKSLLPARERI